MKLVLPIPPNGNNYRGIRVIRVGARYVPQFFLRPAAKKYHQDTAKYALASGHFPFNDSTLVSVSLRVFRARKSGDLEGFMKVLLDSLEGIAYANDKQIKRIVAECFDDRDNPRVEVEVLPIEVSAC